MTALEAYILARAYTQQAIAGAGALKGAPCQIQSITPITGGNRITFAWENSEGETETDTLDVMDGTNGKDGTDGTDGVGISSITFKEKDASGNNVYTVTLTNTNTYDITCPIGPQGETGATGATGNGIASIAKTGTAGLVDTYTITYTNGTTSTFTVTNGEGNNEFIGTLAEWNNLTTAEKKAFDTYQITDDYTGGSGLPNYSTTEQKTGQKWIDGRDVFCIVISFGALPNATQKLVNSGLSNVTIIDIHGIAIKSGAIIPLPYTTTTNQNVQLHYSASTNHVSVATVQDLTSYTESYVYLLYVKNPN